MTDEKYRDTSLSPRERAEDLLHRMTVTEKVGQLNQRLYGFHAYEKIDSSDTDVSARMSDTAYAAPAFGEDASSMGGSHWRPSEEFCQEVERYSGLGVLYGLYRADPWSGRTYETGLVGGEAIKVYNMLQHYVLEHSRFGIPMLLSEESPHGHQALDGYLLPVNLAVGAAFDPELVGRAAHVCGSQLKKQGVDLALVSMLDVLRDPRWGRSEECFGEDPYLASVLADSVTRGLHAEGVDVVAKHFAAQGETTGGVNASAARIGERELREIHLPPAEAAVKAGASGIMAAYNEIDGIPCHANAWLLQDVLRGEMGFDGFVMADGLAVDRLKFLGLDPAACGATALNAGVDVSLWDNGFSRLEEALERGLIPEDRFDEAVLRVLTLKFERGLFDQPYLTPDGARTDEAGWHDFRSNNQSQPKTDISDTAVLESGNRFSSGEPSRSKPEPDAPLRCAVLPSCAKTQAEGPSTISTGNPSLDLARESVILLKNTGVLPLAPSEGAFPLRVALVGERSRDIYAQLGDYTPPVRPEACRTIEQGLQDIVDKYPNMQLTSYPDARAAIAAAENDVTILVVGGSSSRFGEVRFDTNGAAIIGQDASASTDADAEKQPRPDLQNPTAAENSSTVATRQTKSAHITMDCGEGVDVASLTLPEDQLALAREVYACAKGTVITVVLAGRPYVITELAERTDALLYAFYPGPYGGQAIAELIFGDEEPSGRLPASLPRSVGQLPVFYNPRMSYEAMHYCDEKDGPLYPFGYGLGYEKASYSDFQVTGADAGPDIAPNTGSETDAYFSGHGKNTATRPATPATEESSVSDPQAAAKDTIPAGKEFPDRASLLHDDKDLQQSGRGHLLQLPYIGSVKPPIEVSFTATNPTEATVYAVPMLFIRRLGGTSGVIPRREELKEFGKQRLLPGESRHFSFTLTEDKIKVWNRKMEHKMEGGHLILEIKDGGKSLWETVVSISAKS